MLTRQPELVFINIDGIFEDTLEFTLKLRRYQGSLTALVALSSDTKLAYQAIKHGFYDYLITPITVHDITPCITGLLSQPDSKDQFICLKSYKDFHFLKTQEILLLKADNNTTDFHMLNGDIITAFKTLKTFENKLPIHLKRIHKSYIINTCLINRIDFGKGVCRINHFKNPIPFSKKYLVTMESIFCSLSKIMY